MNLGLPESSAYKEHPTKKSAYFTLGSLCTLGTEIETKRRVLAALTLDVTLKSVRREDLRLNAQC